MVTRVGNLQTAPLACGLERKAHFAGAVVHDPIGYSLPALVERVRAASA